MEAMKKSKYVLTDWEPNNPDKWNSGLAWRTLAISTYSLILAFTVWFLVSAIAPKLNEIGFDLTKAQLYWLTSMPGLSCGFLRLIYTFLPPIVGTRKLVGWSSILYMIPMLGWFFAVQNPNTPYWWLLALAFMCGIGGGSFSGYMPSTGYFFPKRLSGTASRDRQLGDVNHSAGRPTANGILVIWPHLDEPPADRRRGKYLGI